MATISSPGIGSGLDVASIVNELMAVERLPLEKLVYKQDQYKAQISAYGVLKSTLSTFQSSMDKLNTISGLKIFKTQSSNPDVVTVTTGSNADLGNFNIEVTRVADFHKMSSVEIASTDVFGGNTGDSFSIQVGADPLDTLSVDLSTAMSLQEIRNAINDDVTNPGVQATIVNGDGGVQKLVLTSDETGAANALTLSYGGAINAATFGMQTLNDINGDTSLLDAQFSVDGFTITRSGNSISDVISGVTFNLVSADPGVTHTIGIERDLEAVEEVMQSFVDAFNQLRSSIKGLRGGQLEADSSLLSIENQIFNVLNSPATGGVYSVLSEVGLTMQKDGTMSLESSKLRSALGADYSGVAQLFAADGQGFANRLTSLADSWLTADGLIETRTDGLNSRIDDLVDRQDSMERHLEIVEQRYWVQFSALDSLLGQLQGVSSFLTQQLDSLPGNNRKN